MALLRSTLVLVSSVLMFLAARDLGRNIFSLSGNSFDRDIKDHMPTPLITPVEQFGSVLKADVEWGRYREPLPNAETLDQVFPSTQFSNLRRMLQLKRWAYMSFSSEDLFLGFAVVQLNYMSQVFVYAVDSSSKSAHIPRWDYTALFPMGMGVNFAKSSADGCTTWEHPMGTNGSHLSICALPSGSGYDVAITVPLTNVATGETRMLDATLEVPDAGEALSLLFNVGRDHDVRPVYVHKAAGMPAGGQVVLGDHVHHFNNPSEHQLLAALDWTYAYARHTTAWHWASFSARVPIRRVAADGGHSEGEDVVVADVGLNLSELVYDLPDVGSQENAIWVNGRVYALPGTRFVVPGGGALEERNPGADPFKDSWSVASFSTTDGTAVSLSFSPSGGRTDAMNIGILASDFVQPYGRFSGSIKFRDYDGELWEAVISPDAVFGVMERHYAAW